MNKNIFKKELIKGLSKKNKIIPSKYHYDYQGSRYFEKITHQKEYYPNPNVSWNIIYEYALINKQSLMFSKLIEGLIPIGPKIFFISLSLNPDSFSLSHLLA